MEILVIKITKCPVNTYWYHNLIGKTIFAEKSTTDTENLYVVDLGVRIHLLYDAKYMVETNKDLNGCIISVEDCEIITTFNL
jgi:hypothetical protein